MEKLNYVSNEIEKSAEGVKSVITKKLPKEYPENTILIVAVDEACFIEEHNWKDFVRSKVPSKVPAHLSSSLLRTRGVLTTHFLVTS